MAETPDLSKIVNLIMENPALIEQISSLARSSGEEVDTEAVAVETEGTAEAAPVAALPKRSARRHELIGAMKPYLSEKRSKTVDSVMAIADILDLMRR